MCIRIYNNSASGSYGVLSAGSWRGEHMADRMSDSEVDLSFITQSTTASLSLAPSTLQESRPSAPRASDWTKRVDRLQSVSAVGVDGVRYVIIWL